MSEASILEVPGVCYKPDSATSGFKLNHTMLRVKDPKTSLDFYTRILGMKLLRKVDFSEWKFSLYFLGLVAEDFATNKENDLRRAVARLEGVLELTHNHGTENLQETPYINGNTEPHRGFGHICISVPNIQEACARFEKLGVNFKKKLGEGGMKDIAFILDPDNYWVEIIEQ